MKRKKIDRRNFLKTAAATIAGTSLSSCSQSKVNVQANESSISIRKYNKLGRTDFYVSDIGSGKSSNPVILKKLIDSGINYIDTAEIYSNGQCEKVVGEAIKGKKRSELFITTKLKMLGNPSTKQILERAYKCMERMEIDYIDCLMLHSCQNIATAYYEPFHEATKQLKNEHKLKFVGISNHGSTYNENGRDPMDKVLLAAVQDGRYDVVLLVYNFLNKTKGEKVLEACRDKNIGTVIMKINPIGSYETYKNLLENAEQRGNPTKTLKKRLNHLKKKADLAKDYLVKNKLINKEEIRDAAYRFVLSNDDANCALHRFDNFEQIDSVLKLSGSNLNNNDIKKLSNLSSGCSDLYCRHACGVCESSCPENIPINTIMRYNYYFDTQGQEKYAITKYNELQKQIGNICSRCEGFCQEACPYKVPIQGLLYMAHNNLSIG